MCVPIHLWPVIGGARCLPPKDSGSRIGNARSRTGTAWSWPTTSCGAKPWYSSRASRRSSRSCTPCAPTTPGANAPRRPWTWTCRQTMSLRRPIKSRLGLKTAIAFNIVFVRDFILCINIIFCYRRSIILTLVTFQIEIWQHHQKLDEMTAKFI